MADGPEGMGNIHASYWSGSGRQTPILSLPHWAAFIWYTGRGTYSRKLLRLRDRGIGRIPSL